MDRKDNTIFISYNKSNKESIDILEQLAKYFESWEFKCTKVLGDY